MIITEYFTTREDGVVLNRTYSDEGFYIIQDGTGIKYAEAIDPAELGRTYTETDEPIEGEVGDATEQDYINALNELGVNTDEEVNA